MFLMLVENIWTAIPIIFILHFFIKGIFGFKCGEGYVVNLITSFIGLIGYGISEVIIFLNMKNGLDFAPISGFVLKLFLPLCAMLLMWGFNRKNRNYTVCGISGFVFFFITAIIGRY